ncbi:MAG: amidohydrolase family protein [Thermoplasmata archaeon]
MSILLKGGYVLTQDEKREILEGDVLLEDDRIAEIGNIRTEADHEIDCSGSVVMPGLVNSHNHVANTLLRGYADDVHLEVMLEKSFAVDDKITTRDVQVASLAGCIEMIRTGTTSFLDMFYWENEVARAVRQAGIRGFLGWVVLDREFTTQKGHPLKNCETFIRDFKGEELVKPLVAAHGVYTCSEETFLGAKDLAEREDVPLHFHLSETRKEVYDHVEKYGLRPPEWLEKIGFLCDRGIAAHCVWLTINEIRAIAARGVSAVHCPVSNMKLASGGFAPLPEMFDNGLNVCLGTDSPLSNNNLDMFEEMKYCSLMHKASRWDATVVPAQKALDMATIEGARALGLDNELGSIEEGRKADVIVVNMKKAKSAPLFKSRIPSHLVYSCNGNDVSHTIIDGRIVMQDSRPTNVDEGDVLRSLQEAACDIFGEGDG